MYNKDPEKFRKIHGCGYKRLAELSIKKDYGREAESLDNSGGGIVLGMSISDNKFKALKNKSLPSDESILYVPNQFSLYYLYMVIFTNGAKENLGIFDEFIYGNCDKCRGGLWSLESALETFR